MWIFDGPGEGHHFSSFSQHGLVKGWPGDLFWKSKAKEQILSGVFKKCVPLPGGEHFSIFINMFCQGVVSGTNGEKYAMDNNNVHDFSNGDGHAKKFSLCWKSHTWSFIAAKAL